MQIKKFEKTNGNKEFYGLMGKFFAESKYKKEMPYLVNRENNVWFIAVDNEEVAGFVAVDETKNKIKMEHDYIEEPYREQGLFEKLNKKRLAYIADIDKPIEVIVKEQFLIDYWSKLDFKPYRNNGSYTYLRKEVPVND